ncbi:flagellar protein FlaG [Luminiphilus sp.]|nr:flagellar protein FlaG [Luminiphilus sp.]
MASNSAITVPDMSVGGLSTPINLREEFAKGASGPVRTGSVSFDGRSQASDVASAGSTVVDPQKIEQAVQQITSFGKNLTRSLSISVDQRSGDFVVQVQNSDTKEVVRQIPAEEVLKIAAVVAERNADLTLMGERGAGSLLLDVQA